MADLNPYEPSTADIPEPSSGINESFDMEEYEIKKNATNAFVSGLGTFMMPIAILAAFYFHNETAKGINRCGKGQQYLRRAVRGKHIAYFALGFYLLLLLLSNVLAD